MLDSISPYNPNRLLEQPDSFQLKQNQLFSNTASEGISAAAPVNRFASSASSRNLMAGNFVSAEREQSRYMLAREKGQQAVSQQASRQTAILNAALSALATLDGSDYALRTLNGKKAARRIMEEGQQSVQEASERNLKEIKEEIARRAEEALKAETANGSVVGENTPSTDVATALSNSAGTNVGLGQATATAVVSTPDAAQSSGLETGDAVPPAPSIDIMV